MKTFQEFCLDSKDTVNELFGLFDKKVTAADIKKGASFHVKTKSGEIAYFIKSDADRRGYFDVRVSSLTSGGSSFTKMDADDLMKDFAKGKVTRGKDS